MMVNPAYSQYASNAPWATNANEGGGDMSMYMRGAPQQYIADPNYISSQVAEALKQYQLQNPAPIQSRSPSETAYYHASPNAQGLASLNPDFLGASQMGGLPSLPPQASSAAQHPSAAQAGYAYNFGLGGLW